MLRYPIVCSGKIEPREVVVHGDIGGILAVNFELGMPSGWSAHANAIVVVGESVARHILDQIATLQPGMRISPRPQT